MANQATPPGSTRGWTIGRILGSPVVIAPSWFLAAAVLTFLVARRCRRRHPISAARRVPRRVLLRAAALRLGLPARARARPRRPRARHPGAAVRDHPVGRSHRVLVQKPDAGSSALVSAVGPVVESRARGAAGRSLWQVSPSGSLLGLVLLSGAFANGFVGLFNLLPGLPLDGGRILEAAGVARSPGSRPAGHRRGRVVREGRRARPSGLDAQPRRAERRPGEPGRSHLGRGSSVRCSGPGQGKR